MPTLEWIGKNKVVNHHLEVPYCVLERKYSYDENGQHAEDNGSKNMIIHGDNLLALKSLLPQYEGRIKCIYIDPPYNTGNENWIYNDNVNDPRIKKWLGEVVGKEDEDLSRHDKWLCMMYPRLKLLQRLLADDGAIFISIDDNEQAKLKLVCDEIFGQRNFIAQMVWQKRTSPDARRKISTGHEYLLVYVKDSKDNYSEFKKLTWDEYSAKNYKNPDNDPRGPWTSTDCTAQAGHGTKDQFYTMITPAGRVIELPKNLCWRFTKTRMDEEIRAGRIWFGMDGQGVPRKKTYLFESEGRNLWTWWTNKEVGHTQEATKELNEIFGNAATFDYPKPTRLIQRIMQIATAKDSVILDSFAGSGTTAHAVLKLNKQDGGKRKFILIEMEDYADTVTAERIKKVVTGYPYKEEVNLYDRAISAADLKNGPRIYEEALLVAEQNKDKYDKVSKPKMDEKGHLVVKGTSKKVSNMLGTGGNFSYYELGDSIFKGVNLNEEVGEDELRKYVYFTETKQSLEPRRQDEVFYLGTHMEVAYYFNYIKDKITTLNRDFLHTVKTKAEGYVIYADLCTLSSRELENWHITFKKIPRDISRL